jgi:hypothetical protein
MAKIGAGRVLYAAELQQFQKEPKFSPLAVPGLAAFFAQGISRGGIMEVNGLRSSGRTATVLHVLAQATRQGEVCAVVDLNCCFHPHSAAAAGVRLDRLVWVQCQRNLEHAMRSVDLLLHAGGFGVVLLDLCEAPGRALNQIPLSFWYRFRQVVEHTPTILLVCAETVQAKACTQNALQLKSKALHWTGRKLLHGLEVMAAQRKSVSIRPESLLLTVA